MIDTPPRTHAEKIGKEMRRVLSEQIKDVPPQYRDMVIDYVVNGLAIGWAKSRSKK